MTVTFNHTIVYATDKRRSAKFLANVLGLPEPKPCGEDFDGLFARIQAQRIPYSAAPGRSRPQQINHNDGGRGVYFADPDGHFLEAITRPYGSGAA